MIYACFQVYQFRGFGISCEEITDVGYLALANVSAAHLLLMLVILMLMLIYILAGNFSPDFHSCLYGSFPLYLCGVWLASLCSGEWEPSHAL